MISTLYFAITPCEIVGVLMIVAIITHTHALTVPAPVEIGQTIESLLDEGELSFFQFQLPMVGMTVQLQVQQGRVVMYASSKIRNPSAALYDVRLETDSTASVYLDPSDFEDNAPNPSSRKRQATVMFTNTTIFVSVEGLDNTNNFMLDTTFGDTCKSTEKYYMWS